VSGYRLHDRAIERLALGPTQPPVQWVPGVLSPRLKRGWGMMLTTYLHLVPRSRMSKSCTSLQVPPCHVVGQLYLFNEKLASTIAQTMNKIRNSFFIQVVLQPLASTVLTASILALTFH
jgi:hypothetical protein